MPKPSSTFLENHTTFILLAILVLLMLATFMSKLALLNKDYLKLDDLRFEMMDLEIFSVVYALVWMLMAHYNLMFLIEYLNFTFFMLVELLMLMSYVKMLSYFKVEMAFLNKMGKGLVMCMTTLLLMVFS